jgi:pilus assembly protein CpaF
MKQTTIKAFIETSFLKLFIDQEDITDVSYNGHKIFYQSSRWGRQQSELSVDEKVVYDMMMQLANLSDQHFTYTQPILDLAIEGYRIHAVGPSVSRFGFQKVTTFSLRISRAMKRNHVYPKPLMDVMEKVLLRHQSVLIFGETGSGKTEFQKALIASLPDQVRVVIVDNVLELDGLIASQKLDLNVWQALPHVQVSTLIESALRSNPDWLILAEARGKEMMDVLNASLTGHPVITTIHARDVDSLIPRLTRMVMMNGSHIGYQETFEDIARVFPFSIHVVKGTDEQGAITRTIKGVYERMHDQWNVLYGT